MFTILCLVERREDHHFFALLGVTLTFFKGLLSLLICIIISRLVERQEKDHHFFALLGVTLTPLFFFNDLILFGLRMKSDDVIFEYKTMSMDDIKNFLHTSNI